MSTAYTMLRDILCHQVFVNGSLRELSDATLMLCHLNMLDKCYFSQWWCLCIGMSGKVMMVFHPFSPCSITNVGCVLLENAVIRTISKC